MSGIGLCEHCRQVQIVQSQRGSKFYLCRRAENDASFVKYPRLPVRECRGYERENDLKEPDRGFLGRSKDKS